MASAVCGKVGTAAQHAVFNARMRAVGMACAGGQTSGNGACQRAQPVVFADMVVVAGEARQVAGGRVREVGNEGVKSGGRARVRCFFSFFFLQQNNE